MYFESVLFQSIFFSLPFVENSDSTWAFSSVGIIPVKACAAHLEISPFTAGI